MIANVLDPNGCVESDSESQTPANSAVQERSNVTAPNLVCTCPYNAALLDTDN